MKRICSLLVLSVLVPAAVPAAAPSRAELLGSPRIVEGAAEPSFVQLPAGKLQEEVQVVSARSYAAFGFNNPEVQVHLPRCDNSVYATVEFAPARLLDAKGREVRFEPEQGIYDHETHSDELRFTPAAGTTPVEFSRAEGIILLRYPVRMKTLSMKTGSSAFEGLKITIDGPFVSWTGKEPELPEAAAFTPFAQWRAFDASGRRLEKHPYEESSMSDAGSSETTAYWGAVKEVRVDVVEEWAEVEISYALPSIVPLPADQAGTPPKTGPMKPTPGGKVTMRVAAPKSAPAPAVAAGMSKEDAIARLKEIGFRRFDANSFVLAATQGKADALRLFLAGGMPADTESGGRTALMSAAMMGHVEAGKVLIQAGADVNKTDSTGAPALARLVMKCGATELVRAFIDAGADLKVKLSGGVTARDMAEMAKCTENAKVLKAAGAP